MFDHTISFSNSDEITISSVNAAIGQAYTDIGTPLDVRVELTAYQYNRIALETRLILAALNGDDSYNVPPPPPPVGCLAGTISGVPIVIREEVAGV